MSIIFTESLFIHPNTIYNRPSPFLEPASLLLSCEAGTQILLLTHEILGYKPIPLHREDSLNIVVLEGNSI